MNADELSKHFRAMLANDDGSMPKPLRDSIKAALGDAESSQTQTLFGFPVIFVETCPICHITLKDDEIHGHG